MRRWIWSLALAGLSTVGTAPAAAQAPRDSASALWPVSMFAGLGYGRFRGGVSQGGHAGFSHFGVAVERPRAGSAGSGGGGAWRAEFAGVVGLADVGGGGTLTAAHIGATAGYRRYVGTRYVGAGLALAVVGNCEVDYGSRRSLIGIGGAVSCSSAGLGLRSRSAMFGVHAAAGIQRGAYDFELRVDHGLSPSLGSAEGEMYLGTIGFVVHRRFGSRP